MVPHFVDALILLSLCGGLIAVGMIGILALPWREREMDETVHAVRTAWQMLDSGFHAISGRTQLEPVETRHAMPQADRPSVAFDRPAITRVTLT